MSDAMLAKEVRWASALHAAHTSRTRYRLNWAHLIAIYVLNPLAWVGLIYVACHVA